MKILSLLGTGLESLTRNEIGLGIAFLVGGLSIYVLIVTAVAKTRDVLTRKSPFATDLERYHTSVEQLKKELAGLTPNERFNALAEKLGGLATTGMVAALELSLEQQVKDARSYTHNEVHKVRNEMNNITIQAEERGERLAALEADSKTHTRQNASIESKIDKLISEMGFVRGQTNG